MSGLSEEAPQAQYLVLMRETHGLGDVVGHARADRLLIEIIRRFLPQFGAVCDEYAQARRYYA